MVLVAGTTTRVGSSNHTNEINPTNPPPSLNVFDSFPHQSFISFNLINICIFLSSYSNNLYKYMKCNHNLLLIQPRFLYFFMLGITNTLNMSGMYNKMRGIKRLLFQDIGQI